MPANLSHALPSLMHFFTRTRCFAVLGVAIAMPSYATGQLLRCDSPTGSVHQTDACMQAGRTMDLRPPFPAEAEDIDVQPFSNRKKMLLAQIESDREMARRDAQTERDPTQREKDAQQARCAQYLADRQRTEQTTQPQHRNRIRANDDARALRSQQFAECFAR